ncbi:hypothetical protein ACLOJK_028861 [Asimina triloba]
MDQAHHGSGFEFSVAELLYVFDVALIHLTPTSYKIIQTVVWFCEWRRCCANRHFWRFLHSRKVIQGIVTFTGKHNNKVVSNLPDSVSEWKMRFFYACSKEAGRRGVVLIWGVPDWWRERLPDVVETASVELETS